MQSIFNIRTAYGLPLCLSGLTRYRHFSLSTEIADHDRRRKEMRAKRENRNLLPEDEIDGEVREIEVVLRSSDLIVFNLDDEDDYDDHDQSSLRHSPCTARAA